MRTAIDILKEATERVSNSLNMDVTYQHGRTETIVNYITQLQSKKSKVYPAVIVFTEGMTEHKEENWLEFMIPKIAICTLTKINATEKQRLESTFTNIIYPVFESLEKELRNLHYGYNLVVNRTDMPYFADANKNTLNQLVDGCVIKNLSMKVMYEQCDFQLTIKN